MDLRRISFGRDTAEFDQDLSDYFLETNAYQRMIGGEKSVLVGRKGTGKTALVKYCVENEQTSRQYVLKIEASHSTYVKIDEHLRSFVSQVKNLDSSFKMGWLFTTLIALVHRLSNEETMMITKEERQLHEFATEKLGYTPSDPISAIGGYVTSWVKNLKSLGPLERDVSGDAAAIMDEPRLLSLISAAVSRINAKGKRVFLLFDKLDERWDGSLLYINFLQGLFLASKELKALGCDVCPVVFLRDDIFEEVTKDFQHIDHYRMEIENLIWDEQSLLQLAALRIKSSMTKQGSRVDNDDPEELWRTVFPEDVPHRGAPIPSHAYMIERTLFRPRDIILFATQARDTAIANRHSHVTVSDMLEAESHYSAMKLRDLIAEVSYRYPGIDGIVQRFRRRSIGFGQEELRIMLLETIDEKSNELPWLPTDEGELMRLLYDVGFFSYTTRGGVLRGTRVVHSAVERDSSVITEQERVFVSPIFRRALGMSDH